MSGVSVCAKGEGGGVRGLVVRSAKSLCLPCLEVACALLL